MSPNKKIKLDKNITSGDNQITNETNLLEQFVVKIKAEIDECDNIEQTAGHIDYSESENITNISFETGEPNIVSRSILIDEIDIKDEITFEDYKVEEQTETIDDDGQIPNENETVAKSKLENDSNESDSDQEESLSNTNDPTEDIQIKSEITIEETKVEQYSKVEKTKRKVRCKLCDFHCTSRKSLWRHLNVVHPEENVTRCLLCYEKFQGLSQLEKHIEDEHQGFGNKCNICSALFKKGEWSKHKNQCPGKLLFVCNICEEQYVKKEGILKHLDEHAVSQDRKESSISELREKEQFLACVFCKDDKAYKINHLKAHAKEHHNGYYLECQDCGKSFRDAGSRNNHIKRYCKIGPARERLKDEKIECPECSKCCSNRTAFENHMVANHPKKQYNCKECDIKFPNATSLRYHKVKNHEESSLICSYCSKKFFWKSSLRYHLTLHETSGDHINDPQQRFECQVCLKRFSSPANYKKHQKQHMGNDPENILMECGVDKDGQIIELAKAEEEQNHEISRQKTNKNTSCEFCKSCFASRQTLIKHIKKAHPDNGVVRCNICHDWFQGVSQLEKHVTDDHQGLGNKCDICLDQYSKGTEHKRKCFGRLLFKCGRCESLYVTKERISKHLDEHGVQEDHNGSLISETRIKEHILTCEICDDGRAYRKEPYRKHINDKHFGYHLRCPDCGKTFKHKTSRYKHFKKYCSSSK